MDRTKEIIIKVIPASVAVPFVKAHHYSGKVVQNSSLHFGCFLDGKLHGVLSYGPSMDKRKILLLVRDTPWNGFLELNRMAFDDYLPRNSESHCIAKTLRMIRRKAPHIKWIISFADGSQCGDGTIYRASNFLLTGIKENNTILHFPATGDNIAALVLEAHHDSPIAKKQSQALGVPHKYRTRNAWVKLGAEFIKGYQLRYIYFLDKHYRDKLTVPVLPYSEIDKRGAGMYKGQNIEREQRHKMKCEAQIKREEAKKAK